MPDPVNEKLSTEAKKAISEQVERELAWKLPFGIEVSRKTEFIALAAFTISLSSAFWQFQNYLKGSVVILFPTDQITITSSSNLGRSYGGEENLVKFIATMSYVNEGDVGHNATIRNEQIRVSIGGKMYEHHWYQFVSSDLKNNVLDLKRESESRPFAVTAGGSTSHETLFTPWETRCSKASGRKCNPAKNFVPWDQFIADLQKDPKILVQTRANIYPDRISEAACHVEVRDWELGFLREKGWIAVSCRP